MGTIEKKIEQLEKALHVTTTLSHEEMAKVVLGLLMEEFIENPERLQQDYIDFAYSWQKRLGEKKFNDMFKQQKNKSKQHHSHQDSHHDSNLVAVRKESVLEQSLKKLSKRQKEEERLQRQAQAKWIEQENIEEEADYE